MRQIFYTRFGGPDVLQLGHAEIPEPAPGQVLLKVAGCGLNPIDFKTREGKGFVSQTLGQHFRFVPGYDVSGVVVKTGANVSAFGPGDALFGMVNFPLSAGAYADYVVADAAVLAKAPVSLALPHAGGLALAGLTAWQALFDVGALQPGESVLVLAGAGGVGHLAVQLARWKGAQVSATASAANQDFLQQLGAQPLDYAANNLADHGPWDLVLDLMGGAIGAQAMQWLAPAGRMVTVPTNTAAQLLQQAQSEGRVVRDIKARVDSQQLAQMASLVDQGVLHLHVSGEFPLEQAAAAQAQLAQGHVRGKLILIP